MARTTTGADKAQMTDRLLEGLNDEQRAVVLHHLGPVQVRAGAGSGKTRAIVHRIAYLMRVRDVAPATICAVTFSKKAADEMNERLHALVGDTDARVGTWHSLALQILREEWRDLRTWEVDDRDRYRGLAKQALGYQGMDWKQADLTVVLQFIGECKASLAEAGSPRALEIAQSIFDAKPCGQTDPSLLAEAYRRTDALAVQRRLLTFDDMLVLAWRVFRDDTTALLRWQARFDFLLVDEAQDNNEAQATLARMLGAQHRNVMAVGDGNQAIYAFRGAKPELFARFADEWAPSITITMHRNYRSGTEVVTIANAVQRAMPADMTLGADMTAERGTAAEITTQQFQSLDDEGEAVAIAAQQAHESGTAWRDQVVLFRTNAQSRGVEEAMLRNRIPYVVLGGTNFYDRREIRDLLAYLRVAEGRGDYDDVKRCINAPFRFLGKAFTDRLDGARRDDDTWADTARRVAQSSGIQRRQVTSVGEWSALVDSIARSIKIRDGLDAAHTDDPDQIAYQETDSAKAHMPAALLERIITETDYTRYITRDEGAESTENNRVSNVRELVRAAERFTTVRELLDYIDTTIAAARKAKESKDRDSVTLCSIHRSKGLEYPIVFLIGCNEKVLPHARGDIEEERRLFYVGVTRARDELHVSHVRSAAFGDRVVRLEPSRFLAEAGLISEAAE